MYKNEETRKAHNRKWRWKVREEVYTILGDKCVLCGRVKNLVLHEIYGKKHQLWCSAVEARKRPKDFRLLCKWKCHTGVHFCMERLGMTWKEIEGSIVIKGR